MITNLREKKLDCYHPSNKRHLGKVLHGLCRIRERILKNICQRMTITLRFYENQSKKLEQEEGGETQYQLGGVFKN